MSYVGITNSSLGLTTPPSYELDSPNLDLLQNYFLNVVTDTYIGRTGCNE